MSDKDSTVDVYAPTLTNLYNESIKIVNKSTEFEGLKFIKGDYDALCFILKELSKLEENQVEYGYDVEFPKIYEIERREYTNLTSQGLTLSRLPKGKFQSTPSHHKSKYDLIAKRGGANPSALDNRISNLSTIVPRISSSNSNILNEDTLQQNKSISPYKNQKLPLLSSKNRLSRISENIGLSSRNQARKLNYSDSKYSSESKHSKYSKKVLDMTSSVNYNKLYDETDSLLELIILTLSNAFRAKPKQAAGIVPRDFKFLTVAVVKGK